MGKGITTTVVAAIIFMRMTSGTAEGTGVDESALFPEYRAVVIYTTAEGGPELREVFGQFETLQECLVHAQARTQAMIQRKELYGGEHFCLYREDEKAQPKLLR